MYSKFLVSIIILSPDSINGGTWIFKPFSNVAGLYEEDTVCPFKATSVASIVQVAVFGFMLFMFWINDKALWN